MNRFCSLKLFILLVILTSVNCAIAQTTTTFGYTGAVQTYTVPAGVTKIYVDAIGGRGGMNYYYSRPGYGGRVQCALTVTPGQVLNIYVGGRGAGTGYTSPVLLHLLRGRIQWWWTRVLLWRRWRWRYRYSHRWHRINR
jgi:hypothetical protein